MSFYRHCRWLLIFASVGMVAQAASTDTFYGLSDPTRPFVARMAKSATGSLGERLKVQSIVISPQRRFAMIDGKTVEVGDRLNGAVVVDILPNEVVFTQGGRKSSVYLLSQTRVRRK